MEPRTASVDLQHLPREQLPLALADLHRSLAVGASVELTLSEGDDDVRPATVGRIADVLHGAGFEDVTTEETPSGGEHSHLHLRARRARTLADTVGQGMRMLVCGLNPSVYAADAGRGFARPGNRFWPAAVEAGITTHPHDPSGALRHDGMGMTDLVKRASPAADVLTAAEYRDGLARVERLCTWLRPAVVCFVGLAGWRAAVDRHAPPGPQERTLGGTPVHLCPSTSGRNASSQLPELVEHLRAAASLAAG